MQDITTIKKMIALYCRGNHDMHKTVMEESGLCSECNELLSYALERIEHCPIKNENVFCSDCTVHCYRPAMRDQIKTVMRYSGPRMTWHDPIMAFRYLVSKKRSKHKAAK